MTGDPDLLAALLPVAAALDAQGARWMLSGSLASSHHGIPRATNDCDVVTDLPADRADALVRHLGEGWYADGAMLRSSLAGGPAATLVHLGTLVKVDLMPPRMPFDREGLDRCRPLAEGSPIRMASAEDALLAKLCWYRLGGERSDRQWRDCLGIVQVQAGRLDAAYLDRWAAVAGVADLLARLRSEA